MQNELTIACDESGSEGENIVGSEHRVFTHSSVDLSTDEAAELMREVRTRAPSQASEYKAEQLMRAGPAPTAWLLDSNGPLAGRAKTFLVDKQYFIVSKVVDLLIEEVTHAAGVNLHATRIARDYARSLQTLGPRAFGRDWPPFLDSFNSLMRARQRKGIKTTVDDFFARVDKLRLTSTRRQLDHLLALLWASRIHAEEFQEGLIESADRIPTLDPLFIAVAQAARSWYEQSGVPICIVHDQQTALTVPRTVLLIDLLAEPYPEFRSIAPPVPVKRIEMADSQRDPRVQVADLVAGVSRHLSTLALDGNCEFAELLQPFVVPESIWSDAESWSALSGRPFQ